MLSVVTPNLHSGARDTKRIISTKFSRVICNIYIIDCMVLCTYIEILAFQVVHTDGGVQGLPIVLEALK